MSPLLQVLAGALLAAGFAAVARRSGAQERLWAAGLVVAGLIYVAFAFAAGSAAALTVELLGVAGCGAVAWLGLTRSPLWLAAGWAAHVGWDLLLHPMAGCGYAPGWYVRACIGFDLALAAWIGLRPQDGQAP